MLKPSRGHAHSMPDNQNTKCIATPPTTHSYTTTQAMGSMKLISNSFRDANRICGCIWININLRDLHCESDSNYAGREGGCCKSKIKRGRLLPCDVVILLSSVCKFKFTK